MATVNYSNRDYTSIRQDLLTRASTLVPEWTSRDSSDFGVLLVDLWAYMGDILHYYVDRAAAEAFIDTATQRESLLSLANLFDYVPQYQTASTAQITVSGANIPAGVTVVIPAETVFVAPATATSPIVYFSSSESASATSVSNAVITVIEGEKITDELVGRSNGSAGQRYKLFYKNVIGNSVTVNVYEGTVVGGQPSAVSYRYVSRLLNTTSTDRVYTLDVNANNETSIVFGNGVNGKIPASNQKIVVSYRKGKGVLGNLDAGKITQIYQSPSPYLSSIQSTAATGGANVESITNLKTNIPASVASQDRAVSLQDYASLALFVAGIAKATVAYNSVNQVVNVYAVPFISDYLNYIGGTITLSAALDEDLLAYYEPRSLVGASVNIVNTVNLTAVNVTGTIYVQDGHIASYVSDQVKTALDSLFEFDNVTFNQTLSKGRIYRTMLDVEGVDYVTLTLPSTDTVTSGAYGLLKKGTYTLSTVGGVTGL